MSLIDLQIYNLEVCDIHNLRKLPTYESETFGISRLKICPQCIKISTRQVIVEKFTEKTQLIALRKKMIKNWESSGLLDGLKGLSKK